MMMIFMLGIFFLMSIQPVMMVVSMIIMILLYSIIMYKAMGSYWFSYALVMVMLSGILVVFMYMVSLVPNESFEFYNLIYMVIIFLLFLKVEYVNYSGDYSFVSLNLWFSYISLLNLFLVILLLSLMLMVVWLSCVKEGAVRVK